MRALPIAVALLASGCLMSNEISGGWDNSYSECEDQYVVIQIDDEDIQDNYDCIEGGFSIGVPASMTDFVLKADLYQRGSNRVGSWEVPLVGVDGDLDVGWIF